MENTDSKQIYKAPKFNEVHINVQGVLCQSGGINSMIIDQDGGEYFE